MATDAKAITVESSPTEVLKSLTPAQHKAWRETGNLPEPAEVKPEVKTDGESSTPAKTETPEPPQKAAETPAESVPAKAVEAQKPSKGAEERIKFLLAENKKLAAELETARKSPATVPTKKQEELVKPRRTDVDEKSGQPKYATDEEFLDARDKYVAEMASKQTRADIAKEDQERRVAEQNRIISERWLNALKIAHERHPDFDKVCGQDDKGALQNAELKAIKTNGVLDAFIIDSEIGGIMLYYFASHSGEVARIQSLNSFAAARELTRLEDKLLADEARELTRLEDKLLADEASISRSTSEPEKKAEQVSATVTKAPAPAASVNGKATAAVDEAEAALKRGDFRSYMKTENEKEFRAKKG